LNPTISTSLQTYSFSFLVPSTAKTLRIGVGTGSVVNTNYIIFGNVQLEAGAVATPFEFEDAQVTLAKCERYFQKFVTRIEYNNGSATNTYIDWQFKTSMRATPTVVNNGGAATAEGTTENRYYAYRTGGNTVAIGAGSTASAEL
jgi:hypothetical protein